MEGHGYIRYLEHGLPVRRTGLREPRVEVVDEEPVLLTDARMTAVVISNLDVDTGEAGKTTAACHYEVVVAGFGVGGGCGDSACVANGHYSITPFRTSSSSSLAASAIAVRDLTAVSVPLLSSEGELPTEMVLRPEPRKGELWLHQEGARPAELELLINIKRAGSGCSSPTVAVA